MQDNSLFDYRLATLHFNAYLGQLNITVDVLKGYIYLYTGITSTVEPLLMDTFIIRTPLNYEQLIQFVPEKKKNSYNLYLYITDASIARTLSCGPLGPHYCRLADCICVLGDPGAEV